MTSNKALERGKMAFYESIERWIQTLYDHVVYLIEQDKEVIIVAISRKMPRLMQVLLKSKRISAESRELLRRIMSRTDFVTEHALPLLYGSRSRYSFETILIDDTAVFGNTLRNIADEIYFFSKKKPYAIPIFVSDRAYFGESVNMRISDRLGFIDSREIQDYHTLVAELIQENALPIDVEFPILRAEGESIYSTGLWFETLYNNLVISQNSNIEERYGTDFRRESVDFCEDTDQPHRSFTILLRKQEYWRLITSFSKLRFFQQGETMCVGVFSPQALPDNILVNSHLFRNRYYKDIWKIILSHIDGSMLDFRWSGLPERVGRSLVVWANYLLSLSRYNDFAKDYPSHFRYLSIDIKDISLLVGRDIARKLIDILNEIVHSHEVTRPVFVKEQLPNIVVPKALKGPYQSIRTECWLKELGNSIDSTLDRLFDTMDYSKGTLARSLTLTEQAYAGIYETHESMSGLLNMRPYDENVERELNEWIDRNIDAGKLVPSYQPVETYYGERWWQRCFSNSKSCVEL